MKELYLLIAAQLKSIESIKWIDLDMGQIDRKDPALKYPCVLLKLESNNSNVDESGSQQKIWNIQMRTAFDGTGNKTAINSSDNALEKSLYFAQIADEIYALFQGADISDYMDFECMFEGQEQRSDGIVVFKHVFKALSTEFK